MDDVASKAQLDSIFEAMTEGIAILNQDGELAYLNTQAQKLLGLKADRVLRRTNEALTSSPAESDKNRLLGESRFFKELIQTAKPVYGVEHKVDLSSGLKLKLSFNAAPIHDRSGTPVGVIVSITDLTDRSQIEERLFNAHEKSKRRDLETAALFESSKAILERREVGDAVRTILNSCKNLSGASSGHVSLLDKDGKNFKILSLDPSGLSCTTGASLPMPVQGLCKTVYSTGKAVFQNDFSQIDCAKLMPKGHVRLDNVLFAPLKIYGKVVGLLGLANKPGGFNDHDIKVVETFGELAVITLLNSLMLCSIAEEHKSIEEALRDSEKRYRTLFESAMDAIFILDAEGENAGKILAANQAAADMNGYTIDELLTLNIWDLDTTEHAKNVPNYIKRVLNREKIRFETVHKRKDGTVFPVEAHAVLLELEKRKYILAFDRDITENKKAIELSNALNEINAAINSTLDFNEIMQRVVVEAARATGAETSAIALRGDNCWHIKFLHGQMKQLAGAKLTDETAKGMVVAARTGNLVVVTDALNDDRVNPEMMRKLGIRSVMVVPLMVKDEAIGILFFAYHSDKVVFTDAQIDFASKLGASVSLALENARLYQSKRDIADTLQEALLIMPGKLQGVDFAHLYMSATESARVGGDFYDLFELDSSRIGIVIGDVSGKGLEAATLTSLVKNTIRIFACDDDSPASIMKKVNDVVHKFCPLYSFVTSFFCILDTKTGRLIYCNAGHPPAFIKKKTSGLHALTTCSPVIGAFPEFDYVSDEMILDKGDALILYTDGITEARCDSGFFGEERLLCLIEKLTYLEAGDIPGAIFDEIIEFTGGLLADDIALLSIVLRDD